MLSCKDVTEKADDYLDRNLPVMTRVSYRMHLFVCNRCRRYLDQIKVTIGVLNRMEETSPCDDETARNIVADLQAHIGKPEK